MLWIVHFLIIRISCQHLLFTQFTSQSCDVPPSVIRVIEDYETLDVNQPWTDMLNSIASYYYPGECGYATTPNCCYSSTNPGATGDIGSAFLVAIENTQDLMPYLPKTANGNNYLQITAINSTVFGTVLETFVLCDGNCIDGTIRCYENKTVNIYSDSNCEIVSDSIVVGTMVEYSGDLGSFELELFIPTNANFKARFKTWINFDHMGLGVSWISDCIFIPPMLTSLIITIALLGSNSKSFYKKRNFYSLGQMAMLILWLLYCVLYIIVVYYYNTTLFYAINAAMQIFFSSSLYISVLVSTEMLLRFAVLPYFGNTHDKKIRISVYSCLTLIHAGTCWPLYLNFVHAFGLGDDGFENAYTVWYAYFEIWVYVVLIFNGLISTVWVVVLETGRRVRRTRVSLLKTLRLIMKRDSRFQYILLGQLVLLLSYGVLSFMLLHIDVTLDIMTDDRIYEGFYALETFVLTLHFALMDVYILRMKKVFVSSRNSYQAQAQ